MNPTDERHRKWRISWQHIKDGHFVEAAVGVGVTVVSVVSDSNSGNEHVQNGMFLDVVDGFLVGDLNKENMIYQVF